MRAVPVLWSSDIERSMAFYADVLEFGVRYPEYREAAIAAGVVDLVREDAVLQLSMHMGSNRTPSSLNLEMESAGAVDAAFARAVGRGLAPSQRRDSPVHMAPLDQTWGTREVYVNDPDGNCLCFRAWR